MSDSDERFFIDVGDVDPYDWDLPYADDPPMTRREAERDELGSVGPAPTRKVEDLMAELEASLSHLRPDGDGG